MINLQPGGSGRISLRSFDPADLELQEELGHLDRQTSACASQSRLSGQIDVERVLERGQVRAGQGCCACERVEGELQRRRLGLREVDVAERNITRGHVGNLVDCGGGCRAGDAVLDGGY